MHLKIKPSSPAIANIYGNHSTYHEGDSGLDLFINETITVPANVLSFKIDTGISCEAFEDKSKQQNISYFLYPRSSMGAKTPLRLSNSIGLIDSGYRGPLMAAFYNTTDNDVVIPEGDRIVQICMPDLSYDFGVSVVDSLDETERGEGGLGSTGH